MVDVIVGLVKWQVYHDVCAKDPDLSDLGSPLGESITGIPKMVVEGQR